jgi:hypothetical protein
LPGGKRGSKLAARADAELGEDLPQVVGDGGGADEQLRATPAARKPAAVVSVAWPQPVWSVPLQVARLTT